MTERQRPDFQPGDRVVTVFKIIKVAEKGQRGVVTDDAPYDLRDLLGAPIPPLKALIPVKFDNRATAEWVFRISIRHLDPVDRLAELA